MEEVYLLEALRSPFGSFGGALADMPAPQLAAEVIKALLLLGKISPEEVDEVIIGQVLTGGVGQAPARQAMILAGLPAGVAAMTINKVCGSGLKAMMLGAQAIRAGEAKIVVAGGMENMSLSPYALPAARSGMRLGHQQALDLLMLDGLTDPYSGSHMGEIMEKSIAEHRITRQQQDAFAIRSYERAQRATREGILVAEIVPICKKTRKGEETVSEDEEPFRVKSLKIDDLRPAFTKDGTITAANASSINDGAALALLAGGTEVSRRGLQPLARVVATATHSIAPSRFGEAPVGAIEMVCARAKLQIPEIGLFEINEAFAAVPIIAQQRLGIDPERINVNGGAVAIGHPIGASGGRLMATLAREMKRRGERYGLVTLCIGGGEAVAAIIERA